jgi:hypothetical protein
MIQLTYQGALILGAVAVVAWGTIWATRRK